ncbi:hypothetical protein KBD49_14775 [Myxococcota bacterium]|nr:hypothetical protein [Myxococcota bacterium]
MARQWWLTLLSNAALLVSLSVIYGILAEWAGRRRPLGRLASGTAFGFVAVLVMAAPLHLEPGLQYDGRSVVISMAGLFAGGWTAAIAGVIAAAYRIHLGGIGVLPGMGTIVTSALAGWGWRRWIRGRVTGIREWHLVVFGLLLHLAVLAWQAMLPGRYLSQVFLGVGPAFLSVFTLGTLLLGWLLAGVERRIEDRQRDLEGHLREVTRLHEELNRRHRDLAALHRELGRHVAMTAHDLKAPVRAVLGFADVLRTDIESPSGGGQREILGRILDAASRMESLLEELERYARVIQVPISRVIIPVRPLVEQVTGEFPEFLRQPRLAPRTDGPADVAVLGDRELLERCLQNLLSNAVKFVRPGEAPRIEIRWSRPRPGWVRLEVRDRGIGVPEQDRDRIFEPYERLHGRETYPGSGLGLAMVRRAVDRMEGHCGVEANPDGGSVFFLELPEAEETR